MTDPKPTRNQGDLAQMLDTLLDKGVVINADVAVTVGDTELLGIQVRAAIASFETAAEYGLEFPGGTDMERVREASGVDAAEVMATDGKSEAGTLEETRTSPTIDAADASDVVDPESRGSDDE
jgi:L-cysteine desulfidase